MDVLDEIKIASVDVNPALNRIRDEIISPLLKRLDTLQASVDRLLHDGIVISGTVKPGGGA